MVYTYKTKKLMITGGSGSLGTNIIDYVQKNTDWKIAIYSRDEAKQAKISDKVDKFIGDVRDRDHLTNTVRLWQPDYIIHAAALKRLDDCDKNIEECIKTNIIGSINCCKAAEINNVEKSILISTDKSCQAVGAYAGSKLIAERLFVQYNNHDNNTIFGACRYGNVSCSRHSFIPVWLEKIENNETINITDVNCTRFLFTLRDATELVLYTLTHIMGGEIIIPIMKSYRIIDVVKALEIITGKTAKTRLIGLRPAEKLHESMICETEAPLTKIAGKDKLAIMPQFGKQPSYKQPFLDKTLCSVDCIDDNIDNLVELIKKSLECKLVN